MQHIRHISNENQNSSFGCALKEREFSGEKYRYGFQNQEMDDELKGEGNSINFTYRMHDPRLGRFFAIDVYQDDFASNSPYSFSANSVIAFIELEGLEAKLSIAGIKTDEIEKEENRKSFRSRAKKFIKNGFKFKEVNTGQQLIKELENATKAEGSISAVFTFSHGCSYCIALDESNGFYTDKEYYSTGSADISDITKKIDEGKIKFDANAVWVIGACNTASDPYSTNNLAYQLSLKLGITVIGADPTTGSKYNENGELILTGQSGDFYKYENKFYVQGWVNDQLTNKEFDTKEQANEFVQTQKDNGAVLVGITIEKNVKVTNIGSEINPLDYVKEKK